MRLKLQYQVTKEELEFIKTIKRNLIAELATDNLVGLIKHESKKDLPFDELRADFFVITNEQAKQLLNTLPDYYRKQAYSILSEEIPELNIPST